MGLRCWPGALCEIRWPLPHCANLIGKRIVVTELTMTDSPAAWFYETFDGRPLVSLEGVAIRAGRDLCLQPINPDTGEDWTREERDMGIEVLTIVVDSIRGFEHG